MFSGYILPHTCLYSVGRFKTATGTFFQTCLYSVGFRLLLVHSSIHVFTLVFTVVKLTFSFGSLPLKYLYFARCEDFDSGI